MTGDRAVKPLSQTALAAVLGFAIGGLPADSVNAAPREPVTAPPIEPILPLGPTAQNDAPAGDDLKKALDESNKKLSAIQEQLRYLTELLNGKKDDKGFPLPSDPGLVAEVRNLKDRLEKLERDLAALKTQTALRPPANPGSSGSLPSPMPGPGSDLKAGKATVRVVNEYPVQVSIVVNGTSYRVAPSKSVDIEVPAGEFTYQLLESGAGLTRSSIREKETVTLRIK